jgi:hypothetical protein
MKFAYIPAIALASALLTACGSPAQDTSTPPETASSPIWYGNWISFDDPKSTLTISAETVTFGYDGTEREPEAYTVESGCPPFPDLPFEDDTIVTTSDGDTFCYAIDSASETRLVLIYLPRGNALDYTRAE